MATKNNPRLTMSEILQEVYNRTGLPRDSIIKVVEAYLDIVRESVMAGVEISMKGLGVFTFKTYKPRDMELKMTPKHSIHKKGDIVHVKGYKVPYFKITGKCKKEMKEKTEFDNVEQ